jgi:hypothetical protein
MNEGRRWKSKLWSEQGRAELEKLALAPWASRRRHELLELLDRMNPTIEELTAAAEQEARKRPEVLRLMTHPGVGPLTAVAYLRVDHWNSESVSSRQADRQLRGDDSQRGFQWRQATAGAHQQARQLVVALLAGGGCPGGSTNQPGVETSLCTSGDASSPEHCEGSDGAASGSSLVLDVAEWLCVFAIVRVRFARGTARNRTWCEVEHRALDGASRSARGV